MRKLLNARGELFALLLMCSDPATSGQALMRLHDIDFFATNWARETYRRIKERYAKMEVTDGSLAFTSLMVDEKLSESTKERLESGYKKFQKERIDANEIYTLLTRLRKLRRLNELSEIINTALLDEDDREPEDIIAECEEHLTETKMVNSGMKDCFWHMGTEFNLSPVLESLMSDEERQFVPTGIAAFDEKNGGINYGSVMLIGGSTGGGKSLVGGHVSMDMAMYEDVCVVPLEMSVQEMVGRAMANKGGVEIHKIMGKKWSEDEKDKALDGLRAYHKKVKKQGNKYTIFRPDQDVSIEDIFTTLHPYNYRVIMIDYVGLLKGADGDDQARKLGQIVRAAKVYAATHNKVVILLAQVDDEGKVRYSRAMAEHANNAWIFVANEHTKEQGIIDVRQTKARNQDPSPFTLEIEYAFMRIAGCGATNSVADDDDKPVTRRPQGKGKKSTPKEKPAGKGYFDTLDDV